ncbi:MAG TPA: MlaD family protein [Mycobacteriales bacterium]|nr:MlaD family protein [Mycobacteriales bacterium]
MIQRALSRVLRTSPLTLGVIFLVGVLVAGLGLFQKNRIIATFRPGETVAADFTRDNHLRPFVSKVKVAGVPVGVVTAVGRDDGGTTEVAMKVDRGTREKLGTAPSAAIRPATFLGGNYYVELRPGGEPGRPHGTIPATRTTTPVELDRVLETLRPEARKGIRSTVRQLDGTLDADGRDAVEKLLRTAPGTLDPAGDVLAAARGTDPENDLTDLVSGLESTARVLSRRDGQLDGIVRDLRTTTASLAEHRAPVARTVADLPATLRSTRAGLTRLDGTLERVRVTATSARPAVRELDRLLARADPVLAEARPLVRDLRPLLADARPAVEQLVPAARTGTAVLGDLSGPVLDRVNGPVMRTVLSPYRGTGKYKGSGSDKPLYQEVGYMIAGLGAVSKQVDANGVALSFQPGLSPGSVGDLPISLEQLFFHLFPMQETER